MKIEHRLVLGGGMDPISKEVKTCVYYDDKPAIIEASCNFIQINCTEISIIALRHILAEWMKHFDKPSTVILQGGYEPVKM